MSLLLPDQIRIIFHPTQVILFRLARGRARRVIDKFIAPCTHKQTDHPTWHYAIRTLEEALPEFCTRKSEVTVVLSNHFARYTLIRNVEKVGSKAEEQELVRLHFARVYGDASSHWSMCLSNAKQPGRPQIACAVDQELINTLRELFTPKIAILRSIQPYLMAAFNQYRSFLHESSWLVLVEDGILCLARLEDGGWRSIKCFKIGSNWQHELAILLDREEFMSADEAPKDSKRIPVIVFAPEYPEPIEVMPENDTGKSCQQYPFSILDPTLWPEPPKTADTVNIMALYG